MAESWYSRRMAVKTDVQHGRELYLFFREKREVVGAIMAEKERRSFPYSSGLYTSNVRVFSPKGSYLWMNRGFDACYRQHNLLRRSMYGYCKKEMEKIN